jgi:hypothetical protein
LSNRKLNPSKVKNPKDEVHQAELPNEKWEAFCRAYVKGMGLTDAAVAAGFSASGGPAHCSRLLRRPDVQARISCLREMHGLTDKPAKVDKQWILNTLVRNIEAGLNANDRAAVNRGLELLGREHGLFTERRIVAQDPLDGMTVEELRALLTVSGPERLALTIETAPMIDVTPTPYLHIKDTSNEISELQTLVPTTLDPRSIEDASVTVPSVSGAAAAEGPPGASIGGAAAATAGGDLHTPPTGGSSVPTDPTQKIGEGETNGPA